MNNFQRTSTTMIVLLCMQLVIGKNNDACNCTCLNRSERSDVCELIRDVMEKTDNMITLMDMNENKTEKAIIIRKSELGDIIDERIKVYLKENQHSDFCKAQKGCEDVKESVEDEEASSIGEIFPNISRQNFEQEILPTTVTYAELEELNVTCQGQNSCQLPRISDTLIYYGCHCGPFCSQLDTCCIDSLFRGQRKESVNQSCQALFGSFQSAYFMVDQCPENGIASYDWKNLCESDNQTSNFLVLVPVTSFTTNITYKNYYCYKCHETGGDYLFWNVQLISDEEFATDEDDNPMLVYERGRHIWMARNVKDDIPVEVNIYITIPFEFSAFVEECVPGVISSCNNSWLDFTTNKKCSEYTSIITVGCASKTIYKNPHCALCNFEDLKDVQCGFPGILPPPPPPPKSNFAYHRFFKVLPSMKCPDNRTWNPFHKECTRLECSEGYTLKNETCVPS